MHHAVDIAFQTDKQTEFGDVLDIALDNRPNREQIDKGFPRVVLALFQPQADPPLVGIDFQHHYFDFLAGRNNLAGVNILFCPAHLRDVDQTFDAGFKFNERAVIGDVADPAGKSAADRVLDFHAVPGIGFELLHAERDTLGFRIITDHLYVDGLSDGERLARMVDTAPRNIGHMQQTIYTAKVHECAVIGDVLDHAFENLTLLEIGEKFVALFGAGFLKNGAARHHDIAASAVHLQNLEWLRRPHQRTDITHRTDIHLAARKECHRAGKIDGKPALDPTEYIAGDPFIFVEGILQQRPGFLAPGSIAAEHGLAVLIFHPFEVNID